MTVTEARAALPEIVDRVLAGEEITLTRHGEAVAVVLRPDRLRARRADEALTEAQRLSELISAAGARRLSDRPGMQRERADELVAAVREGRDGR